MINVGKIKLPPPPEPKKEWDGVERRVHNLGAMPSMVFPWWCWNNRRVA